MPRAHFDAVAVNLALHEHSPQIRCESGKFSTCRRLSDSGALHILHGSYCRSVKDPKVVPIETTNIKQAIVILLWQWTH